MSPPNEPPVPDPTGDASVLQPPGRTEVVDAERCLVIAPHYDDEVLGCGGLILQLTGRGRRVEVLFLTDGAAAAPDGVAPEEHARRRRAEAEAVAETLGLAGIRHLDLPDGQLRHRLPETAAGIAQALADLRPDLVLVPSPLEVTDDHRAAFAALHRLLGGVREGARGESSVDAEGEADELPPPSRADLGEPAVLAYEVNRPLFPDLLVDVSKEVEGIRRAMEGYASQEELHGYLNARLGLLRYRTLSLGPEVESAEGYRRLTLDDFVTHSPAQLLAVLGAAPEPSPVRREIGDGPRMSVVVRTLNRPELLAEALDSIAAGTYRNVEVVLVNDGGDPPQVPEGFAFPVVRVDLPETGGRARAAQAGVEAATGEFVSFLDDDDLAAPEHLATLAGLVTAPGVRVAYTDAAVGVYELDAEAGWREAERRLPYSRAFDPDVLLLDNYIPFNTLAIERGLFAAAGPFDPDLPFFEDWDMLIRLSFLTPFHHLARVTCEYRHFVGGGHHVFGAAPREREDFLAVKSRVLAKHRERLSPLRLAAAVDRLRGEAVLLGEERSSLRRENRRLADEALAARRREGETEERYHRLNGELISLRGEAERRAEALDEAGRELRRLFAEEERLHGELAAQTAAFEGRGAEIDRLHGEIEGLHREIGRLDALVKAMEGTRAWRLHQWWQAKKS